MSVVDALAAAARRPEPFEASDAPFWTDPYIAEQLLQAHLDQHTDAASRTAPELDACVKALHGWGYVGPGRAVLDLGCGPGLLAERLAATGAQVTGVDLSSSSLAYARRVAARRGLPITYREQDFRDLDDRGRYDLVVQSYGELGTLDDPSLAAVLQGVRRALVPGGVFVFDVTTPAAAPDHRDPSWFIGRGGLWRAGEHLVLRDGLDYPEHLHCDRYVVLDADGVVTYRLWKRSYTAAGLAALLAAAGFAVDRIHGSLSGTPYDDTSPWLAVVARRP